MTKKTDLRATIDEVKKRISEFWSDLNNFGIIQRFIIVLALFAMVTIWPMELFKVEHISQGVEEGTRYSPALTESNIVRQEFSPNYETVRNIDVYIANDPDSIDTLESVFRLYNRQGECLLEYFFDLAGESGRPMVAPTNVMYILLRWVNHHRNL